VIDRIVGWNSSSSTHDLSALHQEMSSEIDPGAADIVVGLTGGPERENRHLVKLGHSDTPGRWLVVTGRAGADLPLVLRHELGHAFGAPHVRNVPSVMNEDVRSERSAFDPASAAVIQNNAGLEFGRDDALAGCRLESLEALYVGMAEAGNQTADLIAVVADSYRRRRQPEAALRAYRRALELDPDLLNARLGLGMMSMQSRQFTDAVRFFEEARREAPDIPGLDMNLGIAYAEIGQKALARNAYSRALEADPDDSGAMNNLALLHLDEGDSFRAEQLFRAAVAVRPDFMEALNNLGMLYQKTGRPDEAIRTFRSALLLAENPITHRNLASALLQKGLRAEAREHLEASLRLDPDQPDSADLRQLSLGLR
jgi:Tfp pilus assembly protein PilF